MGSGLTRRSAKPLKIFVFPPRTSLIAAFVQIVPRRLIPSLAPPSLQRLCNVWPLPKPRHGRSGRELEISTICLHNQDRIVTLECIGFARVARCGNKVLGEPMTCGPTKHVLLRLLLLSTAHSAQLGAVSLMLNLRTIYVLPGRPRPRSKVQVTRVGPTRPVTRWPRMGSSADFHGASVKVSSRRMTAILPVGVAMEWS